MSRVEEKAKIKQLLVEAITLLCRNGMKFDSKFCIEALVAITLDEQDVVLININETIETSGNYANDQPESTEKFDKITKKFRTRQQNSKTDSIAYDNNILTLEDSGSYQNDDNGLRINIKYEAVDDNYSGDNEDDVHNLVPENETDDCFFVKAECLDENNDNQAWSNMNADDVYSNADYNGVAITPSSYMYQTAPQRKPRVREKSIMNKSNWRSSAPKMIRPKTSTVIQDQDLGLTGLRCSYCCLTFTASQSLREHVKAVHFQMKMFPCKFCGEAFKWRSGLRKHRQMFCPFTVNSPLNHISSRS